VASATGVAPAATAAAKPDMNHRPRFNIFESSLAAGVKTAVQIVFDVLVMVSPETADRKGGHVD
jgi:hypothetical protein